MLPKTGGSFILDPVTGDLTPNTADVQVAPAAEVTAPAAPAPDPVPEPASAETRKSGKGE